MQQKLKCPLKGFKPCIHGDCAFWVEIKMDNFQTGQPFTDGKCSVAWTPFALGEASRRLVGVQAAIEDTRNKMIGAVSNPAFGRLADAMAALALIAHEKQALPPPEDPGAPALPGK